jgi:hypothetical protein
MKNFKLENLKTLTINHEIHGEINYLHHLMLFGKIENIMNLFKNRTMKTNVLPYLLKQKTSKTKLSVIELMIKNENKLSVMNLFEKLKFFFIYNFNSITPKIIQQFLSKCNELELAKVLNYFFENEKLYQLLTNDQKIQSMISICILLNNNDYSIVDNKILKKLEQLNENLFDLIIKPMNQLKPKFIKKLKMNQNETTKLLKRNVNKMNIDKDENNNDDEKEEVRMNETTKFSLFQILILYACENTIKWFINKFKIKLKQKINLLFEREMNTGFNLFHCIAFNYLQINDKKLEKQKCNIFEMIFKLLNECNSNLIKKFINEKDLINEETPIFIALKTILPLIVKQFIQIESIDLLIENVLNENILNYSDKITQVTLRKKLRNEFVKQEELKLQNELPSTTSTANSNNNSNNNDEQQQSQDNLKKHKINSVTNSTENEKVKKKRKF